MVTWAWPKLSPGEDVVRSTAGHWSPVQGAKQEGVLPRYISCNQFCEIANRGGEVDISDQGLLRLQFQLPLQSKVLTPVGENKCLPKSQLSPLSQSFEHVPRGRIPASTFPVPDVIPTSVEESKCLQKSSLSPLASAFEHVLSDVPRGETPAPASQIPDIIQNKCLQKSSLSPLAPAFAHVPSNVPRGGTPASSVQSLDISPPLVEESKGLQRSPRSPLALAFKHVPSAVFRDSDKPCPPRPLPPDAPPSIPTHSRRRLRRLPSPRLSRPTATPALATCRSRQQTGPCGQVTTPALLHRVRFASKSMLVKSIHIYPCTPIHKKTSLYYSAAEIKQFKQDQRVRAQLGKYTLQPSKKWKKRQSVITILVCTM